MAGRWKRSAAGLSAMQFKRGAELGDRFWLYVVEDAVSYPRLHRIQDPVRKVNQFLFDEGWRALAEPNENHLSDETEPRHQS